MANLLTTAALLICDHHMIIWTNPSLADVLQLSPCVNVKHIHVDHSEWKMLMPPDVLIWEFVILKQSIAAKLMILPPPYL